MRFFMEAYGCTMNQGEARIMAELMEERGWTRTSSIGDAELLLMATCTVIGTTERRMVKRLRSLAKCGKPVLVAGCMGKVQRELVREAAPNSEIIDVTDYKRGLERALDVLEKDHAEDTGHCTVHEDETSVDGIVPIAQGCASQCSYCIAKLARGALRSYPSEVILERVRKELERGAREIRLTALDTAAYGLESGDSGKRLPWLIDEVCRIEGDFRVRVGMGNPTHMMPVLKGLVEAYRNEKVFRFLHLPVQSGNDDVLERMGRGYLVEDFLAIVDAFRGEFRELTLSTDIIVGFPGETEEEFEDSLRLAARVRPDIVNITRFSPRPGTAARTMKNQIVSRIVKERSRRLNRLRAEISRKNNERFLGNEERVLTVERGKSETTVGRTGSYRPVVVFEKLPLGKFFDVRITDSRETYLIGERLD